MRAKLDECEMKDNDEDLRENAKAYIQPDLITFQNINGLDQ